MDTNNSFGKIGDYDYLTLNSTDEERLEVVFKVLLRNSSPVPLNYGKLLIGDKHELFNAKLEATGLIHKIPGGYDPYYKINNYGQMELSKFDSSYIKWKTAADEAKRIAIAYEIKKEELTMGKLQKDLEAVCNKLSIYDEEMDKLRVEFRNAKRAEDDYPKVQCRAKWALRISILAVLVSILIQVLKMIHITQ